LKHLDKLIRLKSYFLGQRPTKNGVKRSNWRKIKPGRSPWRRKKGRPSGKKVKA